MDILMLDEPLLPYKELFEQNNLTPHIIGFEKPTTIKAIYCHTTQFNHANYPQLKYVLCPMTGVYHLIQLPKKIQLFYLNDRKWLFDNIWSTAEHTFSLMIRIMRGLNREIHNKTIGIIGFGRVGQQLYQLLQGWNVLVKYVDVEEPRFIEPKQNLIKVKIEEIFNSCDIISINLTETDLTKNYIRARYFDMCKKQPIILNTARESIINTVELLNAFENGKIAGFGLDIDIDNLNKETQHKLKEITSIYRGAILTPHIAGKAIESRIKTDKYVFDQLIKELGGDEDEDNTRLLLQSFGQPIQHFPNDPEGPV